MRPSFYSITIALVIQSPTHPLAELKLSLLRQWPADTQRRRLHGGHRLDGSHCLDEGRRVDDSRRLDGSRLPHGDRCLDCDRQAIDSAVEPPVAM